MYKISTDFFIWDFQDREFRQEISSLMIPISKLIKNGIELKNPQTGGIARFEFTNNKRNNDFDVEYWKFKNQKHNLTILIWND